MSLYRRGGHPGAYTYATTGTYEEETYEDELEAVPAVPQPYANGRSTGAVRAYEAYPAATSSSAAAAVPAVRGPGPAPLKGYGHGQQQHDDDDYEEQQGDEEHDYD